MTISIYDMLICFGLIFRIYYQRRSPRCQKEITWQNKKETCFPHRFLNVIVRIKIAMEMSSHFLRRRRKNE